MKYIIILLMCFACSSSFAQSDNTKIKQPQVPLKTDARLTNTKLLRVQATLKKLELTLKDVKALVDELQTEKDSLSEMSQQDTLMLQQLMEKKSQLESMISNVMKASQETSNNIAANLKAS